MTSQHLSGHHRGVLPPLPEIQRLAPDSKSIQAAEKVARPGSWTDVGHGDEALWGLCAGSRTYQVRVDLRDRASKCSCPSRKFPCKHALGLLLLAARQAPATGTPPDWAREWLETRRAKAEAKAEPAGPVDPDEEAKRERARQARAEKRERAVGEAVAGLDLWLRDLVRAGLADLDARADSFWTDRARALVDGQAPGLARRVKDLAELPGSAPDWSERVLEGLGQLALISDAWSRRESLPAPLLASLRGAIGFTVRKEDVQAGDDRVTDTWLVAGQQVEEEELVWSERTWLLGRGSDRTALVLRYSRSPGGFGEPLVPGTLLPATLAFYPGALRRRALVVEHEGWSTAEAGPPGAVDRIEAFLEGVTSAVARVPWTDRFPCALRDVRVLRTSGGAWWVRDADGRGLRLTRGGHWTLLAVAGGGPVELFGEWDGARLRPLLVRGPLGYRRLDEAAL